MLQFETGAMGVGGSCKTINACEEQAWSTMASAKASLKAVQQTPLHEYDL
jgi:hypothetical protein